MDFDTEFKRKRVIVWDNGGETTDRYTILIDGKYVFGMSSNPSHPQGFNQYAGNIEDWVVYKDTNHFIKIWDTKETRLNIEDIPEQIKKAVINRIKE